jgi:hypothetical protein
MGNFFSEAGVVSHEMATSETETGRIGIDHPTVVPRNAVRESETDDHDADE